MSEIEKLYKNAGIEPTYYDACIVEDNYWKNEELANKYGTFDMYMNAKCGKQEDCTTLCSCAYTREEYPPFTAEKQLKIEEVILENVESYDKHLEYNKTSNGKWVVTFTRTNKLTPPFITLQRTREEAFAQLINKLWQDLTEQEKEQIRDILK